MKYIGNKKLAQTAAAEARKLAEEAKKEAEKLEQEALAREREEIAELRSLLAQLKCAAAPTAPSANNNIYPDAPTGDTTVVDLSQQTGSVV